MPKPLTYKSAGVSIAANDELVRRIGRAVRSTQNRSVISPHNGFAGWFELNATGRNYTQPVLVGCCDGVGSKVVVAIKARKLATIGIDLVAMNVNDLVTCGASPLFFLDYLGLSENTPRRTAEIIKGIARGCKEAGCALLGGETAEMPDVYKREDFDLAGFAVGIAERERLITGDNITPGDVIIGLASSGIHSNGFTLVRRLFFEAHNYKLSSRIKGLRVPLGTELLRPTRIYVEPILALLQKGKRSVKGMAHITGGGLPGNVPRILPRGCQAVVEKSSWKIPPIFRIIQSLGVAEKEMYRVFNMGIGMVLIARRRDSQAIVSHFKRRRIPAYPIGVVTQGKRLLKIQ